MKIISYCLATFIFTIFFVAIRLCNTCELISKEKIKNSKYLTFDNGIIFKKVDKLK